MYFTSSFTELKNCEGQTPVQLAGKRRAAKYEQIVRYISLVQSFERNSEGSIATYTGIFMGMQLTNFVYLLSEIKGGSVIIRST